MTEDATAGGDLLAALDATVADRLGEGDEWAVAGDAAGVTVTLPDRRLVVRRRDGPDGVDHWTLELAAEGATVSKFGPFDSIDGLVERARTLLDSDVRYTVCCDG